MTDPMEVVPEDCPCGYFDQWHKVCQDFNDLEAENERLRQTLRYVAQPTMGYPGHGDPSHFAANEATEKDARLALAACINLARVALASGDVQGGE